MRAGGRGEGRAIACPLGQQVRGGAGAIREFIDLVLRVQGHWDGLLASYLPAASAREGEVR